MNWNYIGYVKGFTNILVMCSMYSVYVCNVRVYVYIYIYVLGIVSKLIETMLGFCGLHQYLGSVMCSMYCIYAL